MQEKAVIGIDPGITGAMAILGPGVCEVRDWEGGEPVLEYLREIQQQWITQWHDYHVDQIALEKVGALPKDGARSMTTFLTNYGWWQGALDSHYPGWQLVRPAEWQKGRVPKRQGRNDKPGLDVARNLFPGVAGKYLSRKKDHNRADALLIALWAWEQIGGKYEELAGK